MPSPRSSARTRCSPRRDCITTPRGFRPAWARRSGSWGGRTREPHGWSKPSVRPERMSRIAIWRRSRRRWAGMLAIVEALPAPEDDPAVLSGRDGLAWAAMQISARRGQLEDADRYAAMWIRSETDVQSLAGAASGDAERLLAGHRVEAALERGRFAFDSRNSLSLRHGAVKDGFRVACEAALELGDGETLTELLAVVEAIPPGLLAPSMQATRDRMRGHMDAIDGRPEEADRGFHAAAQIYPELGMPVGPAV